MLPVAAAFAIGIAAATFFSWIEVSVALIIGAALLFYLKRIYWSLLAFLAIAGAVDVEISRPHDYLVDVSESVLYSGIVDDVNDVMTSRIITVAVDSVDLTTVGKTKVNIIVPSAEPEILVADRISFKGQLVQYEDETDLPDEIDRKTYYSRKGIFRTGVVVSDSIVKIIPDENIVNVIRRQRYVVRDLLMSCTLSDDSKNFLSTCLLGEADSMDDRRDSYSSSGLAHILALSGLHVAVIMGMLSFVFLPFRLTRFRNVYMLLIIAMLWLFAILTGLSASVVRAVIMATVLAFGVLLQRRISPVNSLALAAFLILIFSPQQLFSAGFQLSFASVAGILMFAEHLSPFKGKTAILRRFGSLIGVSVAAVIGTGIFASYYFHNIPLLFLPANILVLPVLLPLALAGGILTCVFQAAGCDSQLFCELMDKVIVVIDSIAENVSKMPYSSIETGEIGVIVILTSVISILLFKVWLHDRRLVWLGSTVIMACCCVVSCNASRVAIDGTEIYFVQRNSRTVEILSCAGNRLYVVTTALEGDHEKLIQDMRFRYGPYMRKRGISEIEILPDKYESEFVSRNGRWLSLGEKTCVLIDKMLPANSPENKPHVDYVVVAPSFRGELNDIYQFVSFDSIFCKSKKEWQIKKLE